MATVAVEQWLTKVQVAELLAVDVRTVERLIAARELEKVVFSQRAARVSASSVAAYQERQRARQP